MQDIGGCRAIVDSVRSVKEISKNVQNSRTQHNFNTCDDYIDNPQQTGYRGIHLIYRFHSDTELKPCNGLKIEIQIRSLLQHAWATAVETVGTLTRQALKSSRGEAEWLRFFELMGTVVAIEEGTTRVPGTPDDDDELVRGVVRYSGELGVINRLESFRQALKQTELLMTADARYFLLELDPNAGGIAISGFRARELYRATAQYAEAEKRIAESGGDAVLVSVDSIATLRRAYPNYFLDTEIFLGLLQRVIDVGV
jgi:hypothetical protein